MILAGLDVYRNAADNGKGANFDSLVPLVPLLGRRFKCGTSKGDGSGANPSK